MSGIPGPVDSSGEELRKQADGHARELDPLAKHGHRPKEHASLRHPSLEMKIIGGGAIGILAGVVLVGFVF